MATSTQIESATLVKEWLQDQEYARSIMDIHRATGISRPTLTAVLNHFEFAHLFQRVGNGYIVSKAASPVGVVVKPASEPVVAVAPSRQFQTKEERPKYFAATKPDREFLQAVLTPLKPLVEGLDRDQTKQFLKKTIGHLIAFLEEQPS